MRNSKAKLKSKSHPGIFRSQMNHTHTRWSSILNYKTLNLIKSTFLGEIYNL